MRQREPEAEAKPLDPVALSLVLWLGAMVAALGVEHVAERAALVAQNAPQAAAPSRLDPVQVYTAWGG